jgi:signal peptidase
VEPVRLKEILKSDYVKSAILLLILAISVFAFWFGLRAALRAEYPLCGVASGSMKPTLKVGDLIVVQGSNPAEINAAQAPEGDIIVFYRPKGWRDPDDLIVHRAIDKFSRENITYFKTKGDANFGPDNWEVPQDYLIGKVVSLRVPLIGFVTFLMRTPAGVLVILPMLVVIIIDWIPLLKKPSES